MPLHTTFYKGKRVTIFMRDGTKLEGRFVEKHSGYIVLDIGKIQVKDIRSTTITKGR